jgi:hypothetical protein
MLDLPTKFAGGILGFLIAIVIAIPLTLGFSYAQDQGSAVEKRASTGPKPIVPRVDASPENPVSAVEKAEKRASTGPKVNIPRVRPPDDR